MYIKKEFKRTSVYHIVIGLLLFFFAVRMVIVDESIGFVSTIPALLVSVLLVFLGVKLKKANRTAALVLIIFNALQIVNCNLENFEYLFLFGPYIQLDLIHWDLFFGLAGDFGISIRAGSFVSDVRFLKINFIQLVLFGYLLDQYRFIPKVVDQPWEKEFTE